METRELREAVIGVELHRERERERGNEKERELET